MNEQTALQTFRDHSADLVAKLEAFKDCQETPLMLSLEDHACLSASFLHVEEDQAYFVIRGTEQALGVVCETRGHWDSTQRRWFTNGYGVLIVERRNSVNTAQALVHTQYLIDTEE